jgi:SAM-dependent methyltransferase
MNSSRLLNRLWMVFSLSLIVAGLFAQEPAQKKEFVPEEGQDGKDVVWVPSPQLLVDKMLDMAKVTPEDYVIDLGSGDGRTVITAAKRGAQALGIEYNPDMVELSKRNASKEGVSNKAGFVQGDIFESDFSKATVITMFLMTDLNLRLRPTLLELKPGTRIVSNTFTMQEWTPDQTVTLEDNCISWCTAYLWIIPAKVEGTWKLAQGDLMIKQDFQLISGTLKIADNSISISDGRLRGDEITFKVKDVQYTGHVKGINMEGTVSGSGSGKWSAIRTNK